jgi:hypothetical protein
VVWHGPPNVAHVLNALHGPDTLSPADGDPGLAFLDQAARALGARAEYLSGPAPTDPNMIY